MCLLSSLKLIVSLSVSSLLLIVGCAVEQGPGSSTHAAAGITGHVHGGQQPVAYSTVQLYTVGTAADGSAATPLLTQTSMSDANGNFSLSPGGIPLYSCTNATQVYITATGGYPSAGTANPDLAMMTALGPCSALTTGTFITINELTTVAAVSALAPYMSSSTAIGSGSSDAAALDAAFKLASEFVDPSAGTAPGTSVSPGLSVPVSEIDTLADVVAACINSPGGTAGDTSACGQFFSLTTPDGKTPPTNTIDALLLLANNPTLNANSLFNMAVPGAPFQPTLSAAPPDFALNLLSTGALRISPSGLAFPDEAVGGSSPNRTVALTNTGSTAISIASIALTGANASDFSIGNCSPTLAPQATCNLAVSFAPTAFGTRSASIAISSNASAATSYVSLAGVGINSSGSFFASPTPLTFYVGEVGTTSAAQTVALVNASSAAVTLGAISFSGAATDFSQTNDCPALLSAGSACSINVVVTQSTSATQSASLLIANSTATSPLSVGLTENAVGTAGPISLSSTSLELINFDSGPVNLTNHGTVPLLISSISVTPGFTEQSNCGSSLPAGALCTILLTPAYSVVGPFEGNLILVDNAASSPQSLPVYTTNGYLTPLDSFGSAIVGTTSPAVYTFTINAGYTAPNLTPSGPDPGDFSATVTPSECLSKSPLFTCTVAVSFTPTALGPRAATLAVGVDGFPTIALTGTGVGAGTGPLATFVPPTNSSVGGGENFSTPQFTSTVVNGDIYNAGTTMLNFTGSPLVTFTGGNASEFTFGSSTCASLAIGANCRISFTFAPLGTGIRQATMNLYDSISGTTLQIPLAIDSTPPPPTISTTSVVFPPTHLGQSSTQTVTAGTVGGSAGDALTLSTSGSSSLYNPFSVSPSTCPKNGGPCLLTITYSPTQTANGSSMDMGKLLVGDSTTSLGTSATLAGTPGIPSASLSANALNFGTVSVGSASTTQQVTISNTGDGYMVINPAQISIVGPAPSTSPSPDFSFSTSGSATLAPGGSFTVSVSFDPTAVGVRNATLLIPSSAPGSPASLALNGTGQ